MRESKDTGTEYIRLSEMWPGLSPLVGAQRAKELVNDAIDSCRLPRKEMYSLVEFKIICDHLRKKGGVLAMVVTAMASKLIVSERRIRDGEE